MQYFVYLLKCSDNTYYCGYTTDIVKRLKQHNSGNKGAKYTINRRPLVVEYSESFDTLSDALKREHQIKKLSRHEKSLLIKSNQ